MEKLKPIGNDPKKNNESEESEAITIETESLLSKPITIVECNIDSAKYFLNMLKKAIIDFQELKDMIIGWDDKVVQDDRLLIRKKETVEKNRADFLDMIREAFESLYEEIRERGIVKSRVFSYEPEYIIEKIDQIRSALELGLTPELKTITRENNYRDLVTKIVELILEYKKLTK